MDSLTQVVLGASVAGVCAPREDRHKALLMGAALGTLPDLDVLIDYGDAVSNFTYHRGFSHSLLVLPTFAAGLWLVLQRWWAPVRAAPGRWFLAILLTLVTHPLLDAHTVYGTQLLWPLDRPPVMWSTLFIIDPLYSVPLLIGVVVSARRPRDRFGTSMLVAGLVVSTLYLYWSWIAKTLVENHAETVVAEMGLDDARILSVPSPFNTLLWRVVVLTGDQYLEGYDSFIADDDPIEFTEYQRGTALMNDALTIEPVGQLQWFAHDYVRAEIVNDELIVTDLRMGTEPKYIFAFAVARGGNPHWQPIEPRQLTPDIAARDLGAVWRRIWND